MSASNGLYDGSGPRGRRTHSESTAFLVSRRTPIRRTMVLDANPSLCPMTSRKWLGRAARRAQLLDFTPTVVLELV